MSRGERRKSVLNPGTPEAVLLYTSVSSVTKFDERQVGGCERKWWYDKVMGLEEPQQFEQKLGVQAHGQIEHHLQTGADTLAPFVRVGKIYIPEPGPGLHVERHFTPENRELVGADVPFDGYIDLVNEREQTITSQGKVIWEPHVIEVVDWKTTSDIEAWAKTGPQLAETVQMVGYAEWARKTYPHAEAIRISHVYFQTKNAKRSEKRTHLLSVAEVERRWHTIENVISRMREVAKIAKEEDVKANRNACGAYRGCAFRFRCPKSPQERLIQLGGGKAMSLMDKYKQKAAASAASAPKADPKVAEERAALEAEEAEVKKIGRAHV